MKVLIADDEPDVRMGLKMIIDWHSLGFEICGEAANGDECLEKILSFRPELVMLDIRMPKMHGLECAKAARAKGWNGKIIILSGYSDFQFAQGAIQCGVESYLLKPIDEAELTEAVQKIRGKIEEERRKSSRMNFALEKAHSAVLLDILNHKTSLGNKDVNENDLGLNSDRYLVVIPEKGQKEPSPQCHDLVKLLQAQSVEKIKYNGMEVYLLKGSDVIGKFKKIVAAHKLDGIFLAIGRAAESIGGISLSFQDARAVFARKFFMGREQNIVRTKDLPQHLKPCDIGKVNIRESVEKLYDSIQTCDFKSVNLLLDDWYEKLIAMEIQPDYTVNLLINIQIQTKNAVLQDYEKENIQFVSDTEIINAFSKKSRLYEIIDWMKENLSGLIETTSSLKSNHIVDRIRIYIEKNYDKNLKLEFLAQSFGYNSAYLGKIFKNNVGESFNSYLDRVRIEKAKKLLAQQDMKVYEISNGVGYENIDYFYLKFRKYVGVSPSEYRKTIRKAN